MHNGLGEENVIVPIKLLFDEEWLFSSVLVL